jgi:hypothetical protein
VSDDQPDLFKVLPFRKRKPKTAWTPKDPRTVEAMAQYGVKEPYPRGFWRWLDNNWHVFIAFVELSREGQRKGLSDWSAFGVINVLRWQTQIRERGTDFKISNNAAPGLSRLTMAMYPGEFDGFFKIKPLGRRRH